MKYAILGYDFKKHFNIGDYVQSIAARQFLPHVDCLVNREALADYDGENVKLIMNGWYMFAPEKFPPATRITPLFISFHINPAHAARMLRAESVAYLKRYAPIGCRDEQTAMLLRAAGVEAFVSHCLTLTLGRTFHHVAETSSPVIMADVMFKSPSRHECFSSWKKFFRYVRSGKIFRIGRRERAMRRIMAALPDGCRVEYTVCDFRAADYPDEQARFTLAEELLRRYARARLVITSRLHVALPCLAMGTPVVFVDDALDKATERARISEFMGCFPVVVPDDVQDWREVFRKSDGAMSVELRSDAVKMEKICAEFIAGDQ